MSTLESILDDQDGILKKNQITCSYDYITITLRGEADPLRDKFIEQLENSNINNYTLREFQTRKSVEAVSDLMKSDSKLDKPKRVIFFFTYPHQESWKTSVCFYFPNKLAQEFITEYQQNKRFFSPTLQQAMRITRLDIKIQFPIKLNNINQTILEMASKQDAFNKQNNQSKNLKVEINSKGIVYTQGRRDGPVYSRDYVKNDVYLTVDKNTGEVSLECEIKRTSIKRISDLFFKKQFDEMHATALQRLTNHIRKREESCLYEPAILFRVFAENQLLKYKQKKASALIQLDLNNFVLKTVYIKHIHHLIFLNK